MAEVSTKTSTLVFFVNGRKIVDQEIDPEVTLLAYLRKKLFLTGVKEGCSEGGCGACTVMLSRVDRRTGSLKHMSANACTLLVAVMHGMAVTTVEGIGSVRTRLHPVQERLAKSHGTQCGFCTPGFVMSMYALLRNSPRPSIEEIEENLVGNLCRCTGYRPILEGFRTLGPSGPENEGCGRVDCCRMQKESFNEGERIHTNVLFDPKEFQAYSPTQDIIFPPELRASGALDEEDLYFKGNRIELFSPTDLQGLLSLKSKHPRAKIVAGVDVRYYEGLDPVFIDASRIGELRQFRVDSEEVEIGAAMSLSDVEEVLRGTLQTLEDYKRRSLESLLEMISRYAGKQIRNRGTIGENVTTGSPISDLTPILIAAGAKVKVQGLHSARTLDMDDQFYTGYRQSRFKDTEVLTSIIVPLSKKNEHFKWYKQSKRKDNDVAIVNAAFRAKFKNGTNFLDHITMAYGGMGKTVVVPLKTIAALKGSSWDDDLLEKAVTSLASEMALEPGVPGGMAEYRQIITLSFFVKFHLLVRKLLILEDPSLAKPLSQSESLEVEPLKYRKFQSMQICQLVPPDQEAIDPVGRPLPHVSSLKHSTGEAEFTDDIPHFTNELYAALVTSTVASAAILEIDESEALKIDGVEAFLCAKDIPQDRNYLGEDEEMFASHRVNCVGQIIGVVLAESRELAQRAAKNVKIKYGDIKKPTLTIQEAIESESLWDPVIITKGDTQEALEKSQHILEGEFHVGGQEHFYLEPNAHLAVPKDGEELEIYSSCQDPKSHQNKIARILGLPEHRVVFRVKRVGGAFGGKQARATAIGAPIAFAAHTIQRPVRIALSRHEDMRITGGKHPMTAKWKVGFQDDGKILALDLKLYANTGWCIEISRGVIIKGLLMLHGPYSISNRNLVGYCCKTNLPSNTAFRGFGIPQATLVMDDVITRVSDYLQMDPKEVKERNIYPPDVPENSTEEESSLVNQCWEEVMKNSCYDRRLKEIKEANRKSKTVKRGISAMPIAYGIGFTVVPMQQAGALVLVYTDGSVLLSHAGVEMGQGLNTKMIQVASRVLQVSQEWIYTSEHASDKVPNASYSAASISSDINGMAVKQACEKIVRRLSPFKEKNHQGSWKEWVQEAYMNRVSLIATGFYKVPGVTDYDYNEQKGDPFSYRTYGAAVSEVEIDCLTGNFSLLRTDIVMDVGKSLNPGIDVGQIEGGFLQGTGWLTVEELKYSPTGHLLTVGAGGYKIPSVRDIPRSFNVSLLRNSENPKAVYSSKGIGEPPLLLSVTVFSAIKEAVKDYRASCGMKEAFLFDAPATVERIRMACPDHIASKVKSNPEGTFTPWSISV